MYTVFRISLDTPSRSPIKGTRLCGILEVSTPELDFEKATEENARASLWSYSQRVPRFDLFLSHTWATKGRRTPKP